MATYNLGRVLPRFRGVWDPTVNYDKLDVVYFEGSSYMAISDNINKRPDENESDWILSAAKGEPGEPGKDGPTYKAGNGISIVNNVISATGGGSGSGETYYSGYGIDIDLATNQINAEVKASFDVSIEWKAVTIPGMEQTDVDNYDPANIFKFNNTIFYSAGPNHHYWLSYDKATDTLKWEPQIWSGFSEFTGQDVYVDVKGHLYYFKDRYQMEYTNAGWRITSINISNPKGRYMINGIDGKDYYFENGNKMYYRDDWGSTTWDKISGQSVNIEAQHIWSDSNSMYMSSGDNQLYFDFDRMRWRTMGWRGDIRLINGGNVWKMNDDIFYSDGVATYQLTYSDYWKRLGNTSLIYGENIFIEPESERVISDVDGHTKELVKGEVKYITRHGDELVTTDKAGGRINEGYGITAEKQSDGSITVSTVVSKAMKPSADYFTKIETIMKGDSALSSDDVLDVWTDNEMNTYLYDETNWYKWNGANFVEIDKTANVSAGRYIWKHQGRIFYTLAGSTLEYIDGSWVEVSFTIDTDKQTHFNGDNIVSSGNIAYCFTYDNSKQYQYICRLLPGSTTWLSERISSQLGTVIPWVDNEGVCYFGNYKIVNDEVVISTLGNFHNGSIVWFNKHSQIYYNGLRYATSDCKTSYDAVWSGEYNIFGYMLEVDDRYICVGDNGCYELKEMKVVDDNNQTLINEHDLDIKLGFIDNILKKI